MKLVIDASVATKWLFRENHSPEADAILTSGAELLAPGLIFFEVGNVLWKRARSGEIVADHAVELMQEFARIPLIIEKASQFCSLTLELSTIYSRTFYDCSYLALAVLRRATLVTADERFANSLRGTPLEPNIRLLW